MENDGLTFVQSVNNLCVRSRAMTRLNFSAVCAATIDDKHVPFFSRTKQGAVRNREYVFAAPNHDPDVQPKVIPEHRFSTDEIGDDINAFFFYAKGRNFCYGLGLDASNLS